MTQRHPNTFRFLLAMRDRTTGATQVRVVAQDRRRRRNVVTGYSSSLRMYAVLRDELHAFARSMECQAVVWVHPKPKVRPA